MKYSVTLVLFLFITGCATHTQPIKLNEPTFQRHGDITSYFFVIIEHGANMKEAHAAANTGYASASSIEFSPIQLIEGTLLKKGLIRVESAPNAKTAQTLLVKWGVSGKRNLLRGFAQEVTIVLVNGATLSPVFSCTAEGYGATEIDDIRDAIISCLSGL